MNEGFYDNLKSYLGQYEKLGEIITKLRTQEEEISRLNNIIDELEKYIQDGGNWYVEIDYKNYKPYINVANVLDKLNELKQK